MAKGTFSYIKWFDELTKEDIPLVGGKGANLGEMTNHSIPVPPGFCIVSKAYKDFVTLSNINKVIKDILSKINFDDAGDLEEKTAKIRNLMIETDIPLQVERDILRAYAVLAEQINLNEPEVAVRSSATAEDLPDASFAGQQDTYLHIKGKDELLKHVKKCWASLWTSRATYYRHIKGFDHMSVLLSVVVQKMVNASKSGVMFTINPISNNPDEIMINTSWGLGEAIVSGSVTPDEYIIDKKTLDIKEERISQKTVMVIREASGGGTTTVNVKDILGPGAISQPCLSEDEVKKIASMGKRIENVYGFPQDIEWAIDRDTGELYILQSRPVTTFKPQKSEEPIQFDIKTEPEVLAKGLAASPGIAVGKVKKIQSIDEIGKIQEGDILVTAMTNPDMVPAMKKAVAVVTDEGGRTCHAAIVSREFGIPCIVGTQNATEVLDDGMTVTVDATRGVVYKGDRLLQLQGEKPKSSTPTVGISEQKVKEIVEQWATITGTKIYMNLGEPGLIDKYKELPFDGIGLMRTEFIFTDMVGIHPMYLVKQNKGDILISRMAEGIAAVAQAIYPRPVVVRFSDFRTNEFRGLEGGDEVEPIENNPMIGWRGVSRYISPEYEEGFRLECRAIRKVREEYGLTNAWVMLPFVRNLWELDKVKAIMASEGLEQGGSLKVWIMAEVPSVVMLAEEFAKKVDGISIGSNDLTQLTLGVDRDSGILNRMGYFDEQDPAVLKAIEILIDAAHKYGKTCSICGQAPSLYPGFAEFLVRKSIDSMSVNPDTVAYTKRLVASVEQRLLLERAFGKQ